MKVLISAIFIVAAIAQQTQPIPTMPDGYAYGPATTNYTLDVFYDHVCTDSAAAYPALNAFWTSNQSWLRMVIHIYPLPYHYYSFDVGRAGRFIQLNYPAQFTNFMVWMFNHQSKYLDAAQAWDQSQLYNYLATDTQTATGVPFSLTENSLNNITYNYDLRISWKYATSHGITGTPQYMLNGIWIPAAADFTQEAQWEAFFGSLN